MKDNLILPFNIALIGYLLYLFWGVHEPGEHIGPACCFLIVGYVSLYLEKFKKRLWLAKYLEWGYKYGCLLPIKNKNVLLGVMTILFAAGMFYFQIKEDYSVFIDISVIFHMALTLVVIKIISVVGEY